MAKGSKNEILLSIALEGDAEGKSKLKAVRRRGEQEGASGHRKERRGCQERRGANWGIGRNRPLGISK